MKSRRIAVIVLTGVALAAAGGGAIAATKDDPESAVIDDAAKRLNVTPKALRDALKAAEDAQLDQAVKDGNLTQEQADAIKRRRDRDGHVLGGGRAFGHGGGPAFVPGGPGGPGGPGFASRGRFDHGGPGRMIAAAAKALGLTQEQLLNRFRNGKTLAAIAKAQGKDLADVKTAVRKTLQDDLAAAVKDRRLTQDRADEILKAFDQRFDRFATRARPAGPPRLHFHGGLDHGGPPMMLDAAAKALGLTEEQLFDRLGNGKSLADVAKAQGKDLADVKAAVRKRLEDDLAGAVKDQRLSQDRADRILKAFDERFDAFATQAGPPVPGPGPDHPGGFGGPPPGFPHP
jgi:hypothetical protein